MAPRGSVLIVEDDLPIRELLTSFLEAEGFDAVGAEDGLEALHLLRALRRRTPEVPCVVLLDLTMPRFGGQEFRRAQQRDPVVAEVPVVVISAASDVEARAESLGAAATVAKPLDLERLLEVVCAFCSSEPQP